jgi:hypothetical protein
MRRAGCFDDSREAAEKYSPRREPWVGAESGGSPGGAKELSPEIFFVYGDFVFREEGAEFVLE